MSTWGEDYPFDETILPQPEVVEIDRTDSYDPLHDLFPVDLDDVDQIIWKVPPLVWD